ncbi:MAG: aldehyde dehydrogenase family protein [Thermoplasmata archaeon]|uniref:aldehyde dehydrogenase (NAD(+)) n=1 Tax=Candidatus Sysuiplasma superficiale TaxID=2823368 RepID=A0A8J7YNU0_9ARCH|nr:aldehyde dehydrogenase family protein [Candidatus Sysuiplasma superficiale]MBX8643610.1 aldehyde dehydrogenase family protein [Candidatus Sysuiplasma superficiale]MCL4347121.1 aldehyde dehydrogenase family protein [Candidatus Thermoplasmatota archaeon]MCL5437123.1 aldehyde dehydrogenase family protein [Candidatus Thermoplasmatota archaeon]
MEKEYGIFVKGDWEKGSGKEYFETVNPTNGDVLARFVKGTAEDVDTAVKSAMDGFRVWSEVPAPMRGELLLEAALNLQKHKNELGTLVSKEMGKILPEGLGEVQEAIDFFKYIAGEGRRMFGETTPSELPDKFNMTVRLPKGPAGLITPWNFPVSIPSWKMGAALISGCSVVLKPATDTPLCAARFVEIVNDAGFPPGVINLVTGSGSEVGTALINHPGIRAVSFTGGVATGREVYTQGARRLVQVHLELGGKNPVIAMDDANLELVLDGVLFGAFGTAGQRCTATSRLILHNKIYERFLDMLASRVEKMKVGNPLEEGVEMGPVINSRAKESILNYIKIGKHEGGTVVTGGAALEGGIYSKGNFIQPTIIETKHGSVISTEEIFGPVLSVIRVSSFEEAMSVANGVQYGLSSSIYTKNINLAFKAIRMLEAGITYINAPTIGAEIHLPFGGVKKTGTGGREAGSSAIEEFTEIKSVFIDYSDTLQKAQIDTDKRFREKLSQT